MAGDRRQLASRNTRWARAVTRWLVKTTVAPNHISVVSMAAAGLAGLCFWLAGDADGWRRTALYVGAALSCQARLLCNLFDGLVAVEGGRGAPDGAFWNEFPDRVSDILILVGVGLAVENATLGWVASAGAIFTAYTRELGRGAGLGADYSGPMAKQHRMAVITAAAFVAMLEPMWGWRGEVLTVALWVVAAGSLITILRRAARIVSRLRADGAG